MKKLSALLIGLFLASPLSASAATFSINHSTIYTGSGLDTGSVVDELDYTCEGLNWDAPTSTAAVLYPIDSNTPFYPFQAIGIITDCTGPSAYNLLFQTLDSYSPASSNLEGDIIVGVIDTSVLDWDAYYYDLASATANGVLISTSSPIHIIPGDAP